ncbi:MULTISPECIES: hypothetical protein [unclassified Streptomyces]|uniref:hypothetical protein n=1 Tax=unclassified Streptomyces TaxID=2593676 RepID=UPI0033249C75
MPARTPARRHAPAPAAATTPAHAGAVAPARAAATARTRAGAVAAPTASKAATGAGARLPWWAIALPAAAFTALFLLHTTAQPPAPEGRPAVGRFLEQVRHTVAP